MKLNAIIQDIGAVETRGTLDIDITAITSDSREVVPGSLFFAVRGFASDGHRYIPQALEKGAAAVVCEEIPGHAQDDGSAMGGIERPSATFIKVANSRHAVALAADAFYGHPSRQLTLVGITGTNGKTTTVTLLYRLFKALGHPSGLLSTIANYVDDKRLETANTTADPITINRLLAEMVEAGCGYCFMEVSSIGVEQDRVTGLEFKLGIFSNL